MSLLSMVQQAADLIGVQRPTQVVSSSDPTIRQLLAVAQMEGRTLAARGPWPEMTREASFTTVAGQANYDLQSLVPDMDFLINNTMWNRTTGRVVGGPMSAMDWQANRAHGSATPFPTFRIREGVLMFAPTPAQSESYSFEYHSKNWCKSSAGDGQQGWQADSDVGILSEHLMTLGLVWRFKKAKGFDYSQEYGAYQNEVSQKKARSGGSPILSLVGGPSYTIQRGVTGGGHWY
ncbi:conserved hypothetical protein [Magnetococcus marinus MC-1]|uniref:Uncharacterized protein n=1 Tax=Magnetococcus marinus (strain ATCC BAA-1437 / JCM 17883 / MC-1) TaxID=156889 RepID=A0L8D4_MAGMM|nr:hypothetical protein [Magnetococcus marinus]ABK44227.1 conserved hypothetical protein [Magnetococcus marinus MC-1]